MGRLPEGVQGYPRWDGALSTFPAFPIIAWQEIRRAWLNQWARIAFILVFAYTLIYFTNVNAQVERSFTGAHTWDQFLLLFEFLPWGAVVVAAIVGGPIFLEDARQGALELYMARAVTRWDYLAGKSLAVLALTFVTMLGPLLIYFGVSYLMFDVHPEGWNRVPLGALAYSAMWALLATGLALGISCVGRSSRAASLILLGIFAVADVLADLLVQITKGIPEIALLSPRVAIAAQSEWLFGQAGEHAFPYSWGLLLWGALVVAGWTLVALRHPRLRGIESAGGR